MGLQWTLISCFLYFEIGLCVLFMLPFISPQVWRKIFKSRLLSFLSNFSYFYVRLLMLGLGVAFLSSISQLRKYDIDSDKLEDVTLSMPGAAQNYHIHLLRAQRNFYISGFTLFLWMILNRIVQLITAQAQLQADLKATHKQALSANEVANKLLNDSSSSGIQDTRNDKEENLANSEKEDATKNLEALKTKLEKAEDELCEAKTELKQTQTDLMTMKSQSEATKCEYDRLLEEYSVLQKKIQQDSNKKDH
ncbi:B-cell receptor-associated protein 31-like [Octopus bimaculoides]|uniref:Endoplasmic reticulum transmembrane protein n=1 Tax=Octopus bimaculoides TaxID=37653 RepID=A0A0L8FRT6_OCTBM|nr:B-cell receptor-associated protein 31-like [Octopus bimaculoides]